MHARLCWEAAVLTAMCSHLWPDLKQEASWLKEWGLLEQTEEVPSLTSSPQAALTMHLHQQTTVTTVTATFSELPSWLLDDLGLGVAFSAFGMTPTKTTKGRHIAPTSIRGTSTLPPAGFTASQNSRRYAATGRPTDSSGRSGSCTPTAAGSRQGIPL